MRWQDRITRFERVASDSITPHPFNFRTHPDYQRNVVTGLLDEVGWVDAIKVNERTGHVIDGHLRLEQALQSGEDVPVLFLDLTEEEEALALATLDKSAELAGVDANNLEVLIDKIDVNDVAVLSFVDDLKVDTGLGPEKPPKDPGDGPSSDNFQFTIRFDDEEQKESWYDFCRYLKDELPDAESFGQRLQIFIQDVLASD